MYIGKQQHSVVVHWLKKFGITKNWKSIHQRGGKFQMHDQHKVICVTVFGTTDWLARTKFFIIALLPFTLSEDAAIQI